MIIDPSGLSGAQRYFLMTATIVPRPIAFVSTVSKSGVLNVAPFSFFNGVSASPPVLAVAVGNREGEKKDTWRNIEETGEFVVNVVDESLTEAMVLASGDYPPDVSEFDVAGLTPAPSEKVRPPRVGEAPAAFECTLRETVRIADEPPGSTLFLGDIVRVHLRDGLMKEGRVEPGDLRAVGRLGGSYYCAAGDALFTRKRPKV